MMMPLNESLGTSECALHLSVIPQYFITLEKGLRAKRVMWRQYNHRLKVHFKGHPYECMANRIEEEKKASLREPDPTEITYCLQRAGRGGRAEGMRQ